MHCLLACKPISTLNNTKMYAGLRFGLPLFLLLLKEICCRLESCQILTLTIQAAEALSPCDP